MRRHFSEAVSPDALYYHAAIRGNQNILHLARGDIRAAGLQPVDQLIDLVGDIDAIPGGDEPCAGRITDDIWYRTRTDLRAFEIFSSVAWHRQAKKHSAKHNDKSDAHFDHSINSCASCAGSTPALVLSVRTTPSGSGIRTSRLSGCARTIRRHAM
jgi:hypothetical protein